MDEDRPIDVAEPSNQQESSATRHSKYYFDDQQSVFLVENTFFKVHRYYLTRGSEVFRTMFSCPSSEHGQEGMDDTKPIHLSGVTSRQFEALLDFFYEVQIQYPIEPRSMLASPVTPNSTVDYLGPSMLEERVPPQLQQLLDLLSISTFYDFGVARESAIRAIEDNGGLDPIDKICYANQCHIPEWLFIGYKELSQRSAPLEVSEAERIGLTTAILVAKARERIIRHGRSQYSFGHPGWEQEEAASVDAIINSVFFNKGN